MTSGWVLFAQAVAFLSSALVVVCVLTAVEPEKSRRKTWLLLLLSTYPALAAAGMIYVALVDHTWPINARNVLGLCVFVILLLGMSWTCFSFTLRR